MNGFDFVAVLPGDMYGRFVDRISYRVGGLFVCVLGRIQISEISEGVRRYDMIGMGICRRVCSSRSFLPAAHACHSLIQGT